MNGPLEGPPSKRAKLEPSSPRSLTRLVDEETLAEAGLAKRPKIEDLEEDDIENQCSICLQRIVDRTVIPTCSHEFCFECVLVWSEQSRRCPLCSRDIGNYLIHNIRSRYDYRKRYLPPLRRSPIPLESGPLIQTPQAAEARRRRAAREREREHRMREERAESDRLERSILKRKWVYEHHLYAKHVASNPHTRYRPYPTPLQFSASPDLISRTTSFLRRELQVWNNLDIEFLTTFVISLMKAIDIRSESAVKLLAEFLDVDTPYVEGRRFVNAEHFAHEVYSFVRSPYRDLFVYDSVVQYDAPTEAVPDVGPSPRSRWRESSRVLSPSPSRRRRSPPSDRSNSWSPPGRRYSRSNKHRSTSSSPSPRAEGHRRHSQRPHTSGDHRSAEWADNVPGSVSDRGPVREYQTGTARGKGKERVHEASNETLSTNTSDGDPASSRTPAARADEPQETADAFIHCSRPLSAQTRLSDRKKPRHRSLVESVHAHLAINSSTTARQADQVEPRTARSDGGLASQTRGGLTAPTLLARLSDAFVDPSPTSRPLDKRCGDEPSAAVEEDQTPSSGTSAAEPAAPMGVHATKQQTSAKFNSPATSSSTAHDSDDDVVLSSSDPDRPRLVSRMKPTSATPTSAHVGLGTRPSGATIGNHAKNAHVKQVLEDVTHVLPHPKSKPNPVSNDIPTKSAVPPISLDTRSRLFAKLEAEKDQVQASKSDSAVSRGPLFPGMSRFDRTFLIPDTQLTTTISPPMDVVDTATLETKLRARARLQVRLAAERRASGL